MRNLIFFVLMTICLGTQAHDSSSERTNDEHPMFKLMNFTGIDQEQLTSEQAIDQSALIIRGTIEKITPGRDFFHEDRLSGRPISLSLFKVKVTDVIKGDVLPGDYVYFEWITGGISAYELDAKKYDKEMILMLRETSWLAENYSRVENRPDGLMYEVDKLYELTTPRTLFIEDKAAGKVELPLESSKSEPPLHAGSLDDLQNFFEGNTPAFGTRVKMPTTVDK